MKIAVAAVGRDEESEISPRAGRSKFYQIFDDRGNLLEVISNPFSRGGGGAGFGVAKMLADKKVEIVIGREMGDLMEEALKARGLEYRVMEGKAKEAVQRMNLPKEEKP
jgi:predicted Fe-Mo cluster-binding NifX family protein